MKNYEFLNVKRGSWIYTHTILSNTTLVKNDVFSYHIVRAGEIS